jgi:ATP-binding cassette, subfamily B, bacterial MsbA
MAQNTASGKKRGDQQHSFALAWRLIREEILPRWPTIALAVAFMAVSGAMSGAFAKLMEHIVDDVFMAPETHMVRLIAMAVMGAFVIRGVTTFAHVVLMNKVALAVTASMQRRLTRHLLGADVAMFQRTPTGVLISHVISDTTMMSSALTGSLTSIVQSSITLIALISVMFWQDWRLSLSVFVVFPALGWVVSRLGRRLRRISGGTQAEVGLLASVLTETFQGIRQVKAYRQEQRETNRVGARIDKLAKLAAKAFRTSELSMPLGEALSGLAIVTVLLYGGAHVAEGKATAGALFSFITAFLLAYEPMKKLAKLNNTVQSALAGAERVYGVLDTPPSIIDAPGAVTLSCSHPSVELRDVHFAYPDKSVALRGISLTVPAGQTVALVGASGSGKSTILGLVMRFHDLVDGTILLGGHDIRTVTLDSLRQHVALVSQEVAVFDDTVAANIAYGRPDAPQAEIESAARAAYAHEFILGLDQGYQTRLGEQGAKLSGGQRQRIAIARAILADAPVLLLDEATSALDSDSERAVQDALAGLRQGRTTIVVAHRLSTIRAADCIYVMDGGQVVEQGRYAELVAAGGMLAHLDRLQIGGDVVRPVSGNAAESP